MDQVKCCPRWAAAGVTSAEVKVGYEASGASLAYAYEERADSLSLQFEAAKSDLQLFLLLPQGASVREVTGPGGSLAFTETEVGNNRYLAAEVPVEKAADLKIKFV